MGQEDRDQMSVAEFCPLSSRLSKVDALGAAPESGTFLPVQLDAGEWPASSPPTPSGLSAVVHRGRVTLAWDPVAGAASYEVRLGPYWSGGVPLARVGLPEARALELAPGAATLIVRALGPTGMISGGVAIAAVEALPPEGLEVESVTELLEE